jgi:hypothetical protein
MTTPDDRTCRFCGGTLRHKRRAHAVYCGNACRADASRLRRLLDGDPIDGYDSVAAFISTRTRFVGRNSPADTPRSASDARTRPARPSAQNRHGAA